MKYRLFSDFGHHYDLHTPPGHYRHDYEFVLNFAKKFQKPCKILDIGCGTGVFLEAAQREGFEIAGLDVSPSMISVAQQKLGPNIVSVQRMQDFYVADRFNLITSLCWSINYCENKDDLLKILNLCYSSLIKDGYLVLQIAHSAHTSLELFEDRENGPKGELDDIAFFYRFSQIDGADHPMIAEYVYICKSLNELLHEKHLLKMTDAWAVADCMKSIGFQDILLLDSWKGDVFNKSLCPFLIGKKREL